MQRSRGLPLPARILLVLAVAALGATVLWAGTGQLGRLVAGVGSALGGVLDQVTATPSPTPRPSVEIGAPVIVPPRESYTNQPEVDLTGSVPMSIVGESGYAVRIYLALKDQEPAPIAEVPVGNAPSFTVPGLTLEKGINDFSATVVGPGGDESVASAVVRFVYDTSLPKVVLASPKDGATVNADTIELTGRTQSRSQLIARNEANNASVSGLAAGDGTFRLTLPLEKGPNGITITVTDPAGNAGEPLVVGVTRGSGVLTAKLSASGYRFRTSNLPHGLTLTASVTDPDGRPLEGAAVTFTLSVPGVPVITSDTVTDGTGTARFETTVPLGATLGTGPATAFVTTEEYGTTSARTVIAIFE